MKLSKIAALFMVPVLALCLVACSAPGGNASESASSDPKIAELTAQKPTNADEAAELYAKLMQKENEIFSSDNALWEKVFNAANKDSAMIEDGSNYGDFLLKTIDGAKDEFTADELKTLKAGAQQIKEIEDKLESLEKEFPRLWKHAECRRERRRFDRWHDGWCQCFERGDEVPQLYGQGPGWQRREQRRAVL